MKNFKIIILLLTSITFIRCTEHVDYDPIEGYQITADVYLQQESDYEAALVGTYDPLQWLFFNIQIGTIASEISSIENRECKRLTDALCMTASSCITLMVN